MRCNVSLTFRALLLGAFLVFPCLMSAQAKLSILLPERTRLLEDQRLDLVVEVRNVTSATSFRVTANGRDITGSFGQPRQVDLDCNTSMDLVYRADLVGFQAGEVRVIATASTASGQLTDVKDLSVYPFSLPARRRNVVLFIGDAMSQPYRDAARIVAGSIETIPGVSGLREGFFDRLLEMDSMPIVGSVSTHSLDRLVPDSANTASAWATGNKIHTNGLGVFMDGTDCRWRTAGANLATLESMLDNPRIETLWEYLKRKYNYRTGIVSTADIADATPAGQGAHTAFRQTRYEVIRQYFENPFLNNRPAFDVILGGGWDQFLPDVRSDKRDMVAEFRSAGFRFVTNATELRGVSASDSRVLGLFFRNAAPRGAADGIRSASDPNMSVAYDKLGLERPGSEPVASLGEFTDQPFLDLMTRKAIEALAGPGGNQPFILMVEAASIDKQSHVNHMAGTVWDTIELDKAIGEARRWAAARREEDTLLVVTADHAQSMVLNGTAIVSDADMYDRATVYTASNAASVGTQTAKVFRDVHSNIRAIYPFNDIDPNQSGPGGPPAHVRAPWIGALGYGPTGAFEFPDYVDANGDGYPENKQSGNRGLIRLSVAFRTGSHTAESVPVTAEGPGAFFFSGHQDQTDLFFRFAISLRGDTEDADRLVKLLRDPRYPQVIGVR
jgi:alkaline phosphatase